MKKTQTQAPTENNEPIKIKTIEELKNLLLKNELDNKRYLFRGQQDCDWTLTSSYKREKKENWIHNNPNFVFEERIEYVKNKGYISKTNLEIMSEMQHYGLKTILLDFTSDIYAALWFATSDPKLKNQDFCIYTFQVDNDIKHDIKFDEDEEVYSCPIENKRGLAQKSYFLLDNKNLETSSKIQKYHISKELKNDVATILRNRNVTSFTIFPDLKGLYLEFENNSSSHYFDKCNEFFVLKDYKKASECYDKVIKINPQGAYYYGKFFALIGLDKPVEALTYCDEAIKNNPKDSKAYLNKYLLLKDSNKKEEREEAKKLYVKAFEIDPQNAEKKLYKSRMLFF